MKPKKTCPACGKRKLARNLDNGNWECLNCNFKNSSREGSWIGVDYANQV